MKLKIWTALVAVVLSSSAFAECKFKQTGKCEIGSVCSLEGQVAGVDLKIKLAKTSMKSDIWVPSKNKTETIINDRIFEITGEATKDGSRCPLHSMKTNDPVGSQYVGCNGTRVYFDVNWKYISKTPESTALWQGIFVVSNDDDESQCVIGNYATNDAPPAKKAATKETSLESKHK